MDDMQCLVNIKNETDDLSVEYEIVPLSSMMNSEQMRIQEEIDAIDVRISEVQQKIDALNTDISRLTNHADGFDYTIAVVSGIIAGLIDSFFVGEFSFERAQDWGTEKVNDFVKKIAKKQGYKGDDLAGAVKHLEEKFPLASDKATNIFGGGLQHHLRDFAHHPNPIGLFFSLLTQFTKKVYGTDVTGKFMICNIPENGLVLIGKNLPEKLLLGVVYWFFHMVSDMAGSSSSLQAGKAGTGLLGPLVSFLKEISALPFFKKLNDKGYKEFSVWISKLFNGTLLGHRDDNGKLVPLKFDLRTEIGVVHELGRQALPVIINECVVRGFYFIRRFIKEIKSQNVTSVYDLNRIDFKNILPFNNRTIVRMMTIASGTFVAVDLGDAAIRSAIKSGGINPAFAANFVLRVNFVGIGRFVVAIVADVTMGVQCSQKRDERINAYNELLFLNNAKVYYKQGQAFLGLQEMAKKEAELWVALEENEQAMIQLIDLFDNTIKVYFTSYESIRENVDEIGGLIGDAEKKNPGIRDALYQIL